MINVLFLELIESHETSGVGQTSRWERTVRMICSSELDLDGALGGLDQLDKVVLVMGAK